MNLFLCTDRSLWDAVVAQVAPEQTSFLHSWQWGEMQQAFGRPVCRYIAREGDTNLAALLCIVMPLPLGKSYVFSPYGPAVIAGATLDYRVLSAELAQTQLAKEMGVVFWRCEPRASIPNGLGFRVHDVEPSLTRVLDLSLGEETLLANMKQKTRYNVRLAEKKGVECEWYTGNDTERWKMLSAEWWKLVSETSERHGIRSHSQQYYETMMRMLGEEGMMEVGVARTGGTTLAMQLNTQYLGTTTYVHGASTEAQKELMAPYALQWSAIQRAVRRGDHWYDFYGVAPEGDASHYLASVSRFKSGFGGQVQSFAGTFEIPLSPLWFTVYRFVKKLRP
jgi:lipid II:glycine glycyltransferase (peptidoglycan interpeptide bridge formation enzyme)